MTEKAAKVSKTFSELVKVIVMMHPEFAKPINREKFSDFVIATVIKDFITDEKVTDDHEMKKKKTHAIYLNTMKAWEEIYGQKN